MISIGFPVYNGEKYLRTALGTLLAQDYSNFELIISDNNSRDSTGEICREFEASDPRVRYIRQGENHGAPWNFAFVLEQARGDYFMWAAHDDAWDPTYMGKCLRTLEAHPEAVLCCTEVNFIDGEGSPSPIYQGWKNLETLGMTPVQRVHSLIAVMGWYALYGLMRPEAVRKVASVGAGAFGIDVVMTLELMLLGHIVKIPEPLFSYRIAKLKTAADFQADFNSEKNPLPPTPIPFTGLAGALLATVYQSNLSREEKTAVFADFIDTMAAPSAGWRYPITGELLGANVTLNDAGFAYLLGQVLARSVPLAEIWSNPLLRAIYSPPSTGPNLVALAKRVLRGQAAASGPSAAEKHREGVTFFERGKIEEASRSFAEALKLEETSDRWVDWATVQMVGNRTSEAEQGLRRALALNGSHTLAALKLGVLMANLGRFEDAVPFLERSLARLDAAQRSDAMRLLDECKLRVGSTGQLAAQVS